ncbi:Rib/alpha-like domain-containing protein [Dolosicoccus paucivorans]|uniref:Rib/alpha-like domain-containing protein n=1 Tax=Dolosicoccus paucivorans TaxID=84521 RepID=UPI00088AB29F|nr:Rib/alpha-like domain-containing protein [Dolosicoccus paucivorans]SDI53769.1 signal peptide-containing protein, YSIRK family [Dolosicoccus paucivorans]
MKDGTKVQHFGIRKFSVGVASVAVAAGIFFGADTALVSAEELETTPPTTEEKSETAPNADDTAEKETPDTNAGTVEENKTDTGATENNAPSNDETKEESNKADKQPLAELHDPKVTDLVTPSGVLPKATDAVTNKNDLPSDTTYKWKENPNVNIPGPGPATVVIAYSDGSNDEKTIMLTVSGDVQKESDVYTAVAKSLTTKINTLPKAEEGVEPEDEFHPFPDNTTFEWAQAPDVTTPGDKKGTVRVNYPDGSTADVKVDVKVEDSNILADKVVPKVPEKTPVVDPAALTEEEKTAVKGKIEEANKDNFPNNTTVAVAENGDATITYSDNSTDKIAGTELVEKADKKQADLNEPEVKELTTDKGVVPEAEEAVTNKQDLPEDAKYSWKTEPEVNVAGPMEATLVVTYSDDSTDEKQVVITVKDDTEESTRQEPQVQNLTTQLNVVPEASEAVTNKDELPTDTKYAWKEAPKVDGPGVSEATVVITYADGSSQERKEEVTVEDTRKQSEMYPPVVKPLTTTINTVPNAEDAVAPEDELHSFPQGTTITWEEEPKVDVVGETTGRVRVTYPDDSSVVEEVKVTVEDSTVQADKVVPNVPEKTPVADPSKLTEEEQATVKQKIEATNPDFPENTTVSVGENGDATITYSDDSTDTIAGTELVEKAVEQQADTYEPEVQKLVTEVNKVPSAEEAVTNKEALPDETKYSWKEEPKVDGVGPSEGTLLVTYPDGSTDEVPVEVEVPDTRKQNEQYPPVAKDITTQLDVLPEAKDGVAPQDELHSFPEGTTVTWKEAPKVDKATKTTGVALVTYPDGSTAEVTVNVTIEDNRSEAEKYEPSYANAEGKAGEALRSAEPSFTSDDGTTPENPEFSLVDGAPDGAVINNLGIITYTPTEEDAAKGTVEIPVLVTYADNSSEQVTFTINVEALADIINRDGNTDAEIPEGYDRAIFKVSSEGVEEFAPIVLDIKKGTPVSTGQIKFPELVAKEGYENPRWVVAEAMTAGAGFRAVPGEKEVSILDIINMISNGGGTQSVTEFRAVADKVEEQQVIWTGRVVVDGEIIAEKPFVGTEEEVSEKLQELANSYTVQADKYTYLGSERVEDTFIYNFDSVKDAEQQVSWTGQVVVDGEIVEEHTYEGTERDVSQKLQELAGSYVGQPDKYTNIQVERNGDTFIYKFDSVKEAEQQVSWTGQVVVDGEIVEEHTYEVQSATYLINYKF